MKTLSVIFASILVGFCALMMTGCGGGGGDDNSADISGTWTGSGSVSGQSGTYSTTLTLSQDGTNVSGDWDGYAVTGTFDGTTLNLTITPFTQSGVSITGHGTGTYDGTYLNNITITATGTKGTQTVSSTASISRLSRSANFADTGADGLGQAMSSSLVSSVE